MDLEFQESDVIFSDHHHHHHHNNYFNYREIAVAAQHNSYSSRNGAKKNKKKKKRISSSLPVNIPDNILQCVDTDDFFEEEDYEDEEIVPPHVIVERRIAGKMAFSVCTGNGRTLKGRDLSEVRNSILRMTGFLET